MAGKENIAPDTPKKYADVLCFLCLNVSPNKQHLIDGLKARKEGFVDALGKLFPKSIISDIRLLNRRNIVCGPCFNTVIKLKDFTDFAT